MSGPTNGFRRSIIFRNIFMGLGGAALFFMSLVLLQQAVTNDSLRDDLAASRAAGECRFDISADVDKVEGAIDVTVAQIIVAAVTEDEGRVAGLGATLSTQIDDLEEANERRDEAVETCREDG